MGGTSKICLRWSICRKSILPGCCKSPDTFDQKQHPAALKWINKTKQWPIRTNILKHDEHSKFNGTIPRLGCVVHHT